MRLVTDNEIEIAAVGVTNMEPRHAGYVSEMLAHPAAGRSLRNYCMLTERPELAATLELSETDRFWSRYYWLARFMMEWNAFAGYDAGIEQQLFQLLEYAPVEHGALPDVEAAAKRDAVVV